MKYDYQKELDREWERLPYARRVDLPAMLDLLHKAKEQQALNSIETERRYRKDHHIYDDLPDPRYRRMGGRQDITDIPTDLPLEQIILDQLGVAHEYGEPWHCPRCRAEFMMAFPPEHCPNCGTPSLIESKTVNLRK